MSTLPSTNDIDLRSVDEALRRTGARLVDRFPVLESVLLNARDKYARAFVWATVQANRLAYDAPIDPDRMLHVDPGQIEYTAESSVAKFRLAGTVVGGDWDRTDTRFEEYDVYRAYEQHFVHGRPWEETEFFQRIVEELRDGRVRWECRTRAEFEARCERIDRLYHIIQTHGYRTQDELLEADVPDPIKQQHELKTERLKDEIAVHIGRDGELLFHDGRNRLSIVKLLGLESVPVRVLRRHEQWQFIRDAYVAGDRSVEDYGDHPDVQMLEFGSAR